MNTTHPSAPVAEVPWFAELQRRVHDALLVEHPEWIDPNGDCPTCDDYDRRFAQLLTLSSQSKADRRAATGSAYSPAMLRTGTESFTGPIGQRMVFA